VPNQQRRAGSIQQLRSSGYSRWERRFFRRKLRLRTVALLALGGHEPGQNSLARYGYSGEGEENCTSDRLPKHLRGGENAKSKGIFQL
jgi:hypothetical protein